MRALKIAVQRNKLRDIDDISGELDELLRNNASTLAGHVAESIKASLRQSLIEGIAANESF
jgi:low affinity Fe/Cu permease